VYVLQSGWDQANVQTSPYRWLSTAPGELLDTSIAKQLAAAFPTEGFQRHDTSQRTRGKRYQNYSRNVTPSDPRSDMGCAHLPALWTHLIQDLSSEEYRRQIAELLDQDVAEAVEVRLVRHGPGDYLNPHADRPDKLFSHILYFNRDWREEWGGCLEILASCDPASLAGRVVPRLGASALMTRCDHSWHQVTPVSDGVGRTRMSLLVHGLRQ
jgi:Rps23 Pro-64 3,4-dihydroxylase Tpa1-like proline 4-hydroxylase